MNGRTHAVIGAASITGAALSGIPPLQILVMAAVSAGFALGPDIDHPGSTISRAMPPRAHKTFHDLSRTAKERTSTGPDRADTAWRRNRGHDPYHRSLTHTGISTLLVGSAAWLLALVPLGTVALTALAAWWCRRLAKGLLPFLAVPVALATLVHTEPHLIAWAVSAGWLSHIVADGCTKAGVPLAWPLTVKGKRWYCVRILGSSLASGDKREWVAAFGVVVLMNTPVLIS